MIGQTISHYRIVEKLGEGGMGVVYRADDTKLRRAVALKFLAPDRTRDAEAKKRFIQEAQAASALDHPNIAVVHEIDETDDGRSFICMAYYAGKTLKELIEAGPLPIQRAVNISCQIADGLQRAHEAGIIHRDIKPANVMITERGEVKIVDFGIAKLEGQSPATRSGPTAGTAAYMSPEQAQGMATDQRSDLFSLGIVLYEMVTGKRPFPGEHESAVLFSILTMDPIPPTIIRPEVPLSLERSILRLLEKEPEKRYQSARDFKFDVKEQAGMLTTTERILTAPLRRMKPNLALAVVLVLVAAAFAALPSARESARRWLGFTVLPTEKYIAVLPITIFGNDSTNQAFADGLIETLTSKITRLERFQKSLLVIPSIEVRQRKVLSPTQAQTAFGITLAVTGSVERRIDQVRLTLNLVDAKTLSQLYSDQIEEQLDSLVLLEEHAVASLVHMLEFEIQPQAVRAAASKGTRDSRAYDLYTQGRGFLVRSDKLENVSLAVRCFERAVEVDSSYALAFAGLGEAYLRRNNLTNDPQWIYDAVKYCARALELDDQLAPVHYTLGLVRTRTGHYEEAVGEFEKALRLDSLYLDTYRALAEVYVKLSDVARADETYKKAIQQQPSYWKGHYDMAWFYFLRKSYNQAEEEFRKTVQLTPDNALGYNGLASAYHAQGQYATAREMFQKSISIEPNYFAFSNLATQLYGEGRYEEAAGMYRKALEKNSTDYTVWGNLASTYYWMGQHDSARVNFERAALKAEGSLVVNPRDVTVLSRLADYYSMLDKKTEALKLIQQAMKLEPKNLQVMKRAVDIYEQVGDRIEALKLLERALENGTPLSDFQSGKTLRRLREDARYKRLEENRKILERLDSAKKK
jgi:serine/threonine-protein kinase